MLREIIQEERKDDKNMFISLIMKKFLSFLQRFSSNTKWKESLVDTVDTLILKTSKPKTLY